MKITFSTIFILCIISLGFGQSYYINNQYNFGFSIPENFEITDAFSKKSQYLQTYYCPKLKCDTFGVFAVTKVIKIPRTPVANVVRLFQKKSAIKSYEKEFLTSSDPSLNVTILSKKYIAYTGRPGVRIDYNFIIDDTSFTGSTITIFISERQIFVNFNSFTLDSQVTEWNSISDKILNSLTTDMTTLNKNIQKERPNSAFVISNKDKDITGNLGSIRDSQPVPPSFLKKVSLGVLNGKATRLVMPTYPPAAKAVHASGAVNVQVSIDIEGNVISATAIGGHPLLRQAAEEVARQSKFNPVYLSGQRVEVTGVIVYNFVAQ
ncbi:MAG: energy transducer TonB [Pyrinomonadaceae bacterium]